MTRVFVIGIDCVLIIPCGWDAWTYRELIFRRIGDRIEQQYAGRWHVTPSEREDDDANAA